jgi:hypothetical protein
VRDSICLVANQVVKTIRAVCIDEAVPNPFSSSYAIAVSVTIGQIIHDDLPLINIGNNFECSLNSVILDLTRLNSRNILIARETQNVERVFTSKRDKLTALRPVNLQQSVTLLTG